MNIVVTATIVSADGQSKTSVKALLSVFEGVIQFTQNLSKGGQSTNHPVTSSDTGKQRKQPNQYCANIQNIAPFTQTLSKEPSQQASNYQNNNHHNFGNSRGGEQQEFEQKAEMDTNRIISKGLYVNVLEYLKNGDMKVLEQLSKEDQLKIFLDVCDDEEGKECITRITTRK